MGNQDSHILLADGETGLPAIVDGIARAATRALGPAPKSSSAPDRLYWDAPELDPNDVAAQRWGLIVPRGDVGDALLDAVAPLRGLREEEQGAPAVVYRVDYFDDREALTFRAQTVEDPAVPEHERPRYLLILGDLHQVSLQTQQVLAHSALVGRLAFSTPQTRPNLDGYRAYAAKAASATITRAQATERPILFFTARDGTRATEVGYEKLMRPGMDLARGWSRAIRFPRYAAIEIPFSHGGATELLDAGGPATGGVLLTISHGLGAPKAGWGSPLEQRSRQGALAIGPGATIDGDAVARRPFLSGGAWLMVACFGAGTPAASEYHHWFSLLAQESPYSQQQVDRLLASIPRSGEPPFIAQLPQAALANPEGPLCVLGHVDLAWTYAFTDAVDPAKSRAARLMAFTRALVRGSRAGVALDTVTRAYRATNDELMAGYEAERLAEARRAPIVADPIIRADLWMQRNDLRSYVLLGDPAARLV